MGIAVWDQAGPHASTLGCVKSPKPVPKWVDSEAHLVLQDFLQVGSPATHTGSQFTTGVLWDGVPGSSASAKPGMRRDWFLSGSLEAFPDLT